MPAVLDADLQRGFLLLEDLGDGIFARLVAADPTCERQLYTAATDVLLHIHRHPAPQGLPELGPQGWADAAAFALDWYRFAVTGDRVDTTDFIRLLTEAVSTHSNGPRVMILRDYHAENLLWLPDRSDAARVGLLDFQLAQMGQPGYDLVSLLQDARRDVPDPDDSSPRSRTLRTMYQKARSASVPLDTIEKAIKRATGGLEGVSYEQITYEGYAPGGVGIIVEVTTDNKNRAAAEVRQAFNDNGGNMAQTGAVSHSFQKKGQFLIGASQIGEDALMELVLEAGAEDVINNGDHFEVLSPISAFDSISKALQEKSIKPESAELAYISSVPVPVGDAAALRTGQPSVDEGVRGVELGIYPQGPAGQEHRDHRDAGRLQATDGGDGRMAGRQHGIHHDHEASGDVLRRLEIIFDGFQCFRIPIEADMGHAGGGDHRQHAVEKARARPQDRREDQLLAGDLPGRGRGDRGLDLHLVHRQVAGDLIADQGRRLAHQGPEGPGRGRPVPHAGQLVLDKRVADDSDLGHDTARLETGMPVPRGFSGRCETATGRPSGFQIRRLLDQAS